MADGSHPTDGGQPTAEREAAWYERNIDRMLASLLKAGRRVMARAEPLSTKP